MGIFRRKYSADEVKTIRALQKGQEMNYFDILLLIIEKAWMLWAGLAFAWFCESTQTGRKLTERLADRIGIDLNSEVE